MGDLVKLVVGLVSKIPFSPQSFLINLALNFAISGVIKALTRKKAPQLPAFQAEAVDRLRIIRSPVQPHRIIYGEALVSGALVFATTTGDSKEFLHMVVVVAGHECEAITDVYLNDEKLPAEDANGEIPSGRFAGFVRVRKHLGSASEAADSDLVNEASEWTVNHRLRGRAYVYLRLKWDDDQKAFPTGIPNPKFLVKGKKDILDPRTSTTGWTDNAALCQLDYLRGAHGYGAADSEVDTSSWITAANICDETVSIPGGGTQKRYTCNGTFTVDRKLRAVMEELLTASGGIVVPHQGTWRGFAAAAGTVTRATLTESDLRGPIRVRKKPPRRELFNAVRGTFVNPADHWQPTDFPAITNATYEAEDGGERIYRDVEFPYTTDQHIAQRLAVIELQRARQGITYEAPVKLTALNIATWDVVKWSIARLGWTDKEFRVIDFELTPQGGINLIMQEEAAASYTVSVGSLVTMDPAPDTNLPNADQVAVPSAPQVQEVLFETRSGVQSKAVVTWTAAADAFVRDYELEHKLVSDTTWTVAPRLRQTQHEIVNIAPGLYDFRVRARNLLGVVSDYSTSRVEMFGLLAAPAAPQGLTISAIGGLAILRWTQSADLDVRIGGRIEFRHSPAQTGATWQTATSIGDALPGSETVAVLPLRAGTYLAKAFDSSGIASSAASVSTKAGTVLAFANLGVLSEHTAFPGSHSSTVAIDGVLKLAGTASMDTWADVDAVEDWDSEGGVAASGIYTFSGGLDLTAVKRVRLDKVLAATVVNSQDRFDSRSGNIDGWEDFDGNAGGQADATLWARETDDDPGASPAWSAWERLDSAEFVARAFEFQARLTTADPVFNVHVNQLGVTADEVM